MLDYSKSSIQKLIKSKDCPDDLLKEHRQELTPTKKFAYLHYGRHMMNRNVKIIRGG